MTRNRLEDLGRLLEKLRIISDHELFQGQFWSRPKDAVGWFNEKSPEMQADIIHSLAYWIEDVDHMIADCWCIARGDDENSEFTE